MKTFKTTEDLYINRYGNEWHYYNGKLRKILPDGEIEYAEMPEIGKEDFQRNGIVYVKAPDGSDVGIGHAGYAGFQGMAGDTDELWSNIARNTIPTRFREKD